MLAQKEKIANRKRLALAIPVVTLLLASFSLTTRAAEETTKSVQDKQQIESRQIEFSVYDNGQDNSGIITITTDQVNKTQDIEVIPFGSMSESIIVVVDGKKTTALPKDPSDVKTIAINETDPTTGLKTVTITTHKHQEGAELLSENITVKNFTNKKEGNIITSEIFKTSPSNDDIPLTKVDVMPKFRNGDEVLFLNWVQSIIVYPKEDAANGTQGTVIVQFIIEKDGTLSNAKVIRSISKTLDAEVLKVINSSEKWTPGTHKGKPVRVTYTIPIRFQLD